MPSNNDKLTSAKEKIEAYYATNLINNGAEFDQEISLWINYWTSKKNKKRYKQFL